MKGKLLFLAGGAIGYVLGTRAGREAYTKIRSKADDLWQDPKVQKTVHQAGDAVKQTASQVASKAGAKVKGSSGDSSKSGSSDSSGGDAAWSTSGAPAGGTSSEGSDDGTPPTNPSGPGV